ncbi:MAG: hypothetical protein RJP96_02730 [Algiphilus sp.]|uniref:hypothetical protein n=1 Tax=Algiphilus sp. TaxID=1872431 RepID=UPI0032EBDE97
MTGQKPNTLKEAVRQGAAIFFAADMQIGVGEGEGSQFSGIAYSGGRIPSFDAVIDLASTEVADTLPLLFGHEHSATIGVIRQTENNGRQLSVAGELFSDIDARAEEIRLKSTRGIRYQMSVGLYEARIEEFPAGEDVEINGQTFHGPVAVLRGGTVRETSVVTLGADPLTSATFFAEPGRSAAPPPHEDPTMPTNEELTQRVNELTAERDKEKQRADTAEASVTELTQRAETAESALAEQKRTAREAEVKQLFQATGREFSEDAAKPYIELSDEAFTAVRKDMEAMAGNGQSGRQQIPEHLFREQQPPSGPAPGGKSPLLADAESRGWTKE